MCPVIFVVRPRQKECIVNPEEEDKWVIDQRLAVSAYIAKNGLFRV